MLLRVAAVFGILALAAVNGAIASVELDGPLAVVVHDGNGSKCEPGLGVCVFHFDGSGPIGSQTVDVSQSIHRAGVATDPEYIPFFAPLLPSFAFFLEGDDLYFEYDALVIAAGVYASIPQERASRDLAGFDFTSENVSLYFHGPSTRNPTGPNGNRSIGQEFGEEGGFPGSSQAGPINEGVITDTDSQLDGWSLACAFVADASLCLAGAGMFWSSYSSTTPNVRAGLEFENVTFASDPAAMNGTSGRLAEQAATSAPIPARRMPTAPSEVVPQIEPGGNDRASRIQVPLPGPLRETPPPLPLPPPPHAISRPSEATTAAPPSPLVAAFVTVALVFAVLVFALYSRFTTAKSLLAHPIRARIVERLQSGQPIRARDLMAEVGISRTALLHHLAALERRELIRCVNVNGHLFVMLPHANGSAMLEAELSHPTRGPILALLRARGAPMARDDVHAAFPSVPRRTRNHALRKLREIGLLAETADGRVALAQQG